MANIIVEVAPIPIAWSKKKSFLLNVVNSLIGETWNEESSKSFDLKSYLLIRYKITTFKQEKSSWFWFFWSCVAISSIFFSSNFGSITKLKVFEIDWNIFWKLYKLVSLIGNKTLSLKLRRKDSKSDKSPKIW